MAIKRETLIPKSKSNIFKVKTLSKTKILQQKKTSLYHKFGFTDAIEETLLALSVSKDPLLQELITK
jgi:hypothetical protein